MPDWYSAVQQNWAKSGQKPPPGVLTWNTQPAPATSVASPPTFWQRAETQVRTIPGIVKERATEFYREATKPQLVPPIGIAAEALTQSGKGWAEATAPVLFPQVEPRKLQQSYEDWARRETVVNLPFKNPLTVKYNSTDPVLVSLAKTDINNPIVERLGIISGGQTKIGPDVMEWLSPDVFIPAGKIGKVEKLVEKPAAGAVKLATSMVKSRSAENIAGKAVARIADKIPENVPVLSYFKQLGTRGISFPMPAEVTGKKLAPLTPGGFVQRSLKEANMPIPKQVALASEGIRLRVSPNITSFTKRLPRVVQRTATYHPSTGDMSLGLGADLAKRTDAPLHEIAHYLFDRKMPEELKQEWIVEHGSLSDLEKLIGKDAVAKYYAGYLNRPSSLEDGSWILPDIDISNPRPYEGVPVKGPQADIASEAYAYRASSKLPLGKFAPREWWHPKQIQLPKFNSPKSTGQSVKSLK